jgi:hypothetical protein
MKHALTGVGGVVGFFSQATAFQCHSFSDAWDPLNGMCTRTNSPAIGRVVNAWHLMTDLFLLLLPVSVVMRLQTDAKKKHE